MELRWMITEEIVLNNTVYTPCSLVCTEDSPYAYNPDVFAAEFSIYDETNGDASIALTKKDLLNVAKWCLTKVVGEKHASFLTHLVAVMAEADDFYIKTEETE